MKDLQTTAHSLTRRGGELRVSGVLELRDTADDHDGQVIGHALVFGDPADGCLVRIHSRCLYGDALRSDDCDCGPELDLAMDMIQREGGGVLCYLEQEGRGLGLVVKAKGLRLGAQAGVDSFTSYRMLGHPEDTRSYGHAAKALVRLGFRSVRLMTNNPDKVQALCDEGLTVRRVPIRTVPRSPAARSYMESKHRVGGHHPTMRGLSTPSTWIRAGRSLWHLVLQRWTIDLVMDRHRVGTVPNRS